jgi:hypothetical protein
LLMMRQGWAHTESLVALTELPVVREEGMEEQSGGVLDTVMRMLVAVLKDDAKSFATAQRRFQAERSIDRYHEVYFEYDRMMAHILARDATGSVAFLMALESQFSQRATDKQLVNQQLLKAGGEDNGLVFDVWAVALALLARHRGIVLEHSTAVVPVSEFLVGA